MSASLSDWRQAVRMPPSYRLANSTLKSQTHFVFIVASLGIICLFLFYALLPKSKIDHEYWKSLQKINKISSNEHYNRTYPLTPPFKAENGIKYRIGIIADLDTNSKDTTKPYTWISYFLKGFLTVNTIDRTASIKWDKVPIKLESTLSQAGRGMELSELIVFNGRLYTIDDRTGVIYEVIDNTVIPWVLLTDGDGKTSKGFKGEWATVRDDHLYIGGLGKEWTNAAGEVVNFNPQWIKRISPGGQVEHLNWHSHYTELREAAGYTYPGYLIHEAVNWSPDHHSWFFLPRRASILPYTEQEDEKRGTNILLTADDYGDNFKNIQVITNMGPQVSTHGFSSFKFVPGTHGQIIVALKSEEDNGNIASYITVLGVNGEVILPEEKIPGGPYKYEGIEFI